MTDHSWGIGRHGLMVAVFPSYAAAAGVRGRYWTRHRRFLDVRPVPNVPASEWPEQLIAHIPSQEITP